MYWQYASNTSEIYGTALAPYFGWMILDMEMEKTLKKIRRQIVQKDKKQWRMLQSIDLAIDHITSGAGIAEGEAP